MRLATPIKIALGLVATLGVTSFAWLAQPSHDGDEEETTKAASPRIQAQGPDPRQPLPMPGRLIGVKISIGLRDTKPTDWSGEVGVSEGRVDGVSVLHGDASTTITGARFTSRTSSAAATKKKAQQA